MLKFTFGWRCAVTEWDEYIRGQDYFKFLLTEIGAQYLLRDIGNQPIISRKECFAKSHMTEKNFTSLTEKLRQFSLIEMFLGSDWEDHYRLTSQGQQALEQLNKII